MVLICGSTVKPETLPAADFMEYKVMPKAANIIAIALKTIANNPATVSVYVQKDFENLLVGNVVKKTQIFVDDTDLLNQLRKAQGLPAEESTATEKPPIGMDLEQPPVDKSATILERIKAKQQEKAGVQEISENSPPIITASKQEPVAEKPAPEEPISVQEPSTWTCPACGTAGNTSKFCGECGAKRPEPTVKKQEEEPVSEDIDFPGISVEIDDGGPFGNPDDLFSDDDFVETANESILDETKADLSNEIQEPEQFPDIVEEEEPFTEDEIAEAEAMSNTISPKEGVTDTLPSESDSIDDDFEFTFDEDEDLTATVEAEVEPVEAPETPAFAGSTDTTQNASSLEDNSGSNFVEKTIEVPENMPKTPTAVPVAPTATDTGKIAEYEQKIQQLEQTVQQLTTLSEKAGVLEQEKAQLTKALAEQKQESLNRVAEVRESLLKDQAILQDKIDSMKSQHQVEVEDKDRLIAELKEQASKATASGADSAEVAQLKEENTSLKFQLDSAYDEMQLHDNKYVEEKAEYENTIQILQEQVDDLSQKYESIDTATSVLRDFDGYTKHTKTILQSHWREEEKAALSGIDCSDMILFGFGAGDSMRTFLLDVQRMVINGDESIFLVDLTLEVLLVSLNKSKTASEFTILDTQGFDLTRECKPVGSSNSMGLFAGPQLDLGLLTINWGTFIANIKAAAKGKKILILLPSVSSFNVAQAFVKLTELPGIKAYMGVNGDTYALQQAKFTAPFIKKGKFMYVISNGDSKYQKLMLELKKLHDVRIYKDSIMFNQLGL